MAVKFAIAYQRSLSFSNVERSFAAGLYSHLPRGEEIAPGNRGQLDGFLMREICREAGRLGLVVHIHTGIGAAPYFSLKGADPLLLETLFDDPSLRSARFVLIHGGWPFERSAGVMLIRPNVYADISVQAINRGIAHAAYHVGQIVLLAKHFASAEWKTLSIPRDKSQELAQAMHRKA